MPHLIATSILLTVLGKIDFLVPTHVKIILCCKNNSIICISGYEDMRKTYSFLSPKLNTNRNSSSIHKNKTQRYSRIWKSKGVIICEFQFASSFFTFCLFTLKQWFTNCGPWAKKHQHHTRTYRNANS